MISPKKLFYEWNHQPKKALGQHFLKDPSVAEMITARSCLSPDDVVVEIGPGLGALTFPVANCCKKIIAIEKDKRLFDYLTDRVEESGVKNIVLIHGDVMKVDFKALAKKEDRQLLLIGNLPYNISSQILVSLIRHREHISRAVFMFQRELAERLTATPNNKDYGRLAVMLGYCAEIRRIAKIEAHLFYPKPKIDSDVIEVTIKNRIEKQPLDEDYFFKVIKAAFGKRRKTLKNALVGSELGIDAEIAQKSLIQSGIDPKRRAETLNIDEFIDLCDAVMNNTNEE